MEARADAIRREWLQVAHSPARAASLVLVSSTLNSYPSTLVHARHGESISAIHPFCHRGMIFFFDCSSSARLPP